MEAEEPMERQKNKTKTKTYQALSVGEDMSLNLEFSQITQYNIS